MQPLIMQPCLWLLGPWPPRPSRAHAYLTYLLSLILDFISVRLLSLIAIPYLVGLEFGFHPPSIINIIPVCCV